MFQIVSTVSHCCYNILIVILQTFFQYSEAHNSLILAGMLWGCKLFTQCLALNFIITFIWNKLMLHYAMGLGYYTANWV